ncbi:MAG: HAD family hydrolase [bacterium]|nr:HAD family hydrolase [bacterium]
MYERNEFIPPHDREQHEQESQDVYENSPYALMRAEQAERGEKFTVAFSDVDNTFHRKDRQEASNELFASATEHGYPIVAVTGNDLVGIAKRQATGELPKFPILIGSVGTEIDVLQADGTYKRDEAYRQMLLKEKHYDRPTIARSAAEMIHDLADRIPEADLHYQGTEQSPYRQAEEAYLENSEANAHKVQEFKVSFHFFADSPEGVEAIAKEAAQRFPGQELVICEEINYNNQLPPDEQRKKYCLDVVPITKAGAVEYVAKHTGVEKGIVAGDSGNDTDMLMKSGKLQAVVVGGAKSELVGAADQVSQEKPGKSSFRRVLGEDGTLKAIYVERGERKGSESIAYAGEVLKRAENIKKIRG